MAFDDMIGVKLISSVTTNDATKQFSTSLCNKKSIRKGNCSFHFAIFESNFDIVLLTMVDHNLATQIKGLYNLVSVTKGKLFASY